MDIKIKFDKKKVLSQAEDIADNVVRYSRKYLPVVARVFLLSYFIQEGFRNVFFVSRYAEFYSNLWGAPYGLFFFIQTCSCILQMAASTLCILKKQVDICVGILLATLFLNLIASKLFFSIYFILRILPVAGGLLFIVVENHPEAKNLYSGLPVLEENNSSTKIKNFLQLFGRVLIVLNFVKSVLSQEWSLLVLIVDAIGGVLVALVMVGYKTKLSALALVVAMFFWNLYANWFFTMDWNSPLFNYYKYMFFQNMTSIGGLLLIVALGPGGVSLDEKKKSW